MKQNIVKKAKFTELYLTGKYSQKELSKKLEISEQTALRWVKEIPILGYFVARKNLANELKELTKKGYERNNSIITQLLTDIERIEAIIAKTKFLHI